MKLIRWTLCLATYYLLVGCAQTQVIHVDPYPLFHDDLFPDYALVEIESSQKIFTLSDTAKAFVDKKLDRVDGNNSRIKALASSIFDHSELNLLYKNDANTIASVTFQNRAANCLSLTIMTYAMADYAGLGVLFQQVSTPDLWVRREGTSLLNRHVNLRLFSKNQRNVFFTNERSYQMDFDSRAQSLRLPVTVIDKSRVLAMFYNNIGAEHLLLKKYTEAYAYFRMALISDPSIVEAWSNLGVLYSRLERSDYAESAYLQALAINDDDSAVWENLSYLYILTGRDDQAQKIISKLEQERKSNPYYHFMLGEIQYEEGNWLQSIVHYKKAKSMNKKQHMFYFALAKSYYKLGDIKNSQLNIKLAQKYASRDGEELLYQSKIDVLNTLE